MVRYVVARLGYIDKNWYEGPFKAWFVRITQTLINLHYWRTCKDRPWPEKLKCMMGFPNPKPFDLWQRTSALLAN